MRLVLNDGTTIENGRAGYTEGTLWCYFTGYTLQQAAVMFFDPSKTARITFQYGEMEDVHEGFTECVSLGVNLDGEIRVCMMKGGETVADS